MLYEIKPMALRINLYTWIFYKYQERISQLCYYTTRQ